MPKISELPPASDPAGSELFSAVQDGVTKKMTIDQIVALAIAHLGGGGGTSGTILTAFDGTTITAWDGTVIRSSL